jgi:hypothetical protein
MRRQRSGTVVEFLPKVVEIAWLDAALHQFLHEGDEVVEGANRVERRGVGGTKGPSSDGEEEGVLDDGERDVAVPEPASQAAVLGPDVPERSGGLAVASEDVLGIALPFTTELLRRHLILLSALMREAKRSALGLAE